jgi:hypothetical protein
MNSSDGDGSYHHCQTLNPSWQGKWQVLKTVDAGDGVHLSIFQYASRCQPREVIALLVDMLAIFISISFLFLFIVLFLFLFLFLFASLYDVGATSTGIVIPMIRFFEGAHQILITDNMKWTMQASKGKVALLMTLVQSGADLKAKDKTGSTALHRSPPLPH